MEEKTFSKGEWVIVKFPTSYTGKITDRMRELENSVGMVVDIVNAESECMGLLYGIEVKGEREPSYYQSWCLESYYKD